MNTTDLPRGIRNNNPGNLMASVAFVWHGQTGHDEDGYCIFKDPVYGIRAMAIVLTTYHREHDCRTVAEYITRWAPPSSNPTESYINFVAQQIGVQPDKPFDLHAYAAPILSAIIRFENGQQPYSMEVLNRGITASHTL